jgi:ABC-type antimicrobial peptide transport system permease subunit
MAMIPLFYNRRSLWGRKITTFASVLGIALVVFVWTTVKMLSHGIETTLAATGTDENAMVLRKGAQAELQSMLTRETKDVLQVSPEIESDAQGPLFSPEEVVLIVANFRDGNGGSNVTVRGVGPRAMAVHSQVHLSEGRMFNHGQREVIVGRKLGARFAGTSLGETIKLGRDTFKVVGVMDSRGSAFESEIWGDVEEILPAFQRTLFSSVTARMKPGAFAAYKARAEGDIRMKVDVKTELDYYKDQSKGLSLFVNVLGSFVAWVFAIGAIIGAMITMYAQVSSRVREIGTLRAIGFQRGAVLTGFVIEALMLSLTGGLIGLVLAFPMTFARFSTMNFQSFSEIVFRFDLTPQIILSSVMFAAIMGLFGGFFPAWRASRMKVVDVIRA